MRRLPFGQCPSGQLSPALVSEFGWLNCFAIADSSRLPLGARYDTRSVLADQSRDVGAGCGWRGVNPIRDLVAPPDFMLIRWQTYRSKGGLYRGKTTASARS